MKTLKNVFQLVVQCEKKATTPCKITRGSAVTDGRYAYITPQNSKKVYKLDITQPEKWKELPECPFRDSGLAIVNGELTAVGGYEQSHCTKKLVTLQKKKWNKVYPPMKNAWSSPAVVTTSDGRYLIVIGWNSGCQIAKVELFQVTNQQWCVLRGIRSRHIITRPSVTLCGDQMHVIDASGKGYSCSFEALLSSTDKSWSKIWTALPLLPVTDSTVATLSGKLLIFGGKEATTPVKTIYQLVEKMWVEIGSMVNRGSTCLVVSSEENVLVVTGPTARDVEECVLNKDKGCEWQGELKAFHYHVKTCSMKNAPQTKTENQQILQM